MRPTAPTFADKHQIRSFGNSYEVRYDTVLDHDTYSFLRVSLEISQTEKDAATVVLNGKEIGLVRAVRNSNGVVFGFKAFKDSKNPVEVRETPFEQLGQATAAIITHHVT